MAGGSKPKPGSKRKSNWQDGARKGGAKREPHAGPGRRSKPQPRSTKASRSQRRMQP